MKLSWSHKLFLRINEHVGRRSRFDRCMKFVAEDLIILDGVMFGVFTFSATMRRATPLPFLSVIGIFVIALGLSLLISYLLGFLFPHRRPIVELPHIKELIVPLSTWKSLPSDHTIISFLFAFIILLMGLPGWGVFFIAIAALIGAGRIYCGVHYPRDIIVGIAIAGAVSVVSWWLYIVIIHRLVF